jgi:hypothetical protein
MPSPKALRWLHVVGYFTTAIVALELGAIGSVLAMDWARNQRMSAAARERTRTHEGPLSAWLDQSPRALGEERKLVLKLAPLDVRQSDGFRFVAMPSFGKQWFALALHAKGNEARGVLVSVTRSDTRNGAAESERTFSMPLPAYQAMVARVDRFSDSWKGDSGYWLDGTTAAFERVRGGRVTSGMGNSATHYARLASMVRDDLSPFLPEVAALDEGWMERSNPKAR